MSIKKIGSLVWTAIMFFVIISDISTGSPASLSITIFGGIWIVGLILWLIVSAAFKGGTSNQAVLPTAEVDKQDITQCPKCAEDIKKLAQICKHCGVTLESQA